MKAEAVTSCSECPFYTGSSCKAGSKRDYYDNHKSPIPRDCPLPIVVMKVLP